MGHTEPIFFLLFLLLKGSYGLQRNNGASLSYRNLANSSIGVPFLPEKFGNFRVSNTYPPGLTEIAPAADITHLYFSFIRYMWFMTERQFTYVQFQDDKIAGSFIEVTTEKDFNLTTTQVGYSAIFALEGILLDQGLNTTYVAIPVSAIDQLRSGEQVGTLEASISGRYSENVTKPINSPSTTPSGQDFATQKLRSRQISQTFPDPSSETLGDSAFDMEIINRGDRFHQHSILTLFTHFLHWFIWVRPPQSYLSDYLDPGVYFGMVVENLTMVVYLERFEVGEKKVTFGDVEQVFRALTMLPSVKSAPPAMEVRAYLLSASGQRLGDPYLKLNLYRFSPNASSTRQVVWKGQQSHEDQVASAKP